MKIPEQQVVAFINKSQNILIAPSPNINGDSLGGALALASALKKKGKNIQLLAPEKLPIKFKLFSLEKSLSYDTFIKRDFILPFDLVLTIKNQDFNNFGEATIINICNDLTKRSPERLSLIDSTASSVSEIIIRLIESIDESLFDEEISTFSLAGIIDATNNFQSQKTSQRTFITAASLISRGGNQQKIIRYFYKNKSIRFLKLWGKVLPNLLIEKQGQLLYGSINYKDFNSTQTNPDYVPQVFDEMQKIFPQVKTIILLWQYSEIKGEVFSKSSSTLTTMHNKLGGFLEENTLIFSINQKNLKKARKRLIKLIKDEL